MKNKIKILQKLNLLMLIVILTCLCYVVAICDTHLFGNDVVNDVTWIVSLFMSCLLFIWFITKHIEQSLKQRYFQEKIKEALEEAERIRNNNHTLRQGIPKPS